MQDGSPDPDDKHNIFKQTVLDDVYPFRSPQKVTSKKIELPYQTSRELKKDLHYGGGN